jgi:NADH-quinone oxidoreductase subunit J
MLIGVVIILQLSIVLIRGFIGTTAPVNTLPDVVAANNRKRWEQYVITVNILR